MSAEAQAEPAVAEPVLIEGPGRYKVFQELNGDWRISRAVGICETCQNCGCGEQGDPIQIPAMVISLAQTQGKGRLMGMLKAVTGRA